MNRNTVELWCNLMRGKQIVGFLGGPPSETFSGARRLALEGGKQGPIPLRSQDEIWGLRDLPCKYHKQVWVGNVLSRSCIELAVRAAACGAFGIIEHPDPSWLKDEQVPSSWGIAETLLLSELECVQVIKLDQCMVGAPSRKPTKLLSVNLPDLELRVGQLPGGGTCCHRKHYVVLRGRGLRGFRTAPAKV